MHLASVDREASNSLPVGSMSVAFHSLIDRVFDTAPLVINLGGEAQPAATKLSDRLTVVQSLTAQDVDTEYVLSIPGNYLITQNADILIDVFATFKCDVLFAATAVPPDINAFYLSVLYDDSHSPLRFSIPSYFMARTASLRGTPIVGLDNFRKLLGFDNAGVAEEDEPSPADLRLQSALVMNLSNSRQSLLNSLQYLGDRRRHMFTVQSPIAYPFVSVGNTRCSDDFVGDVITDRYDKVIVFPSGCKVSSETQRRLESSLNYYRVIRSADAWAIRKYLVADWRFADLTCDNLANEYSSAQRLK